MRRTKRAALLKFWCQTDLGRENSASYYLVTRWSRSSSNFNALIGQTWTGEFMRKIFAASGNLFTDSWSWQNFVPSSCDVFNCLFPSDVQIEIQLLSSAIRGLIIGFLVQECAACQSHWKHNLGCHRFRFSPCLMRKRVKRIKRFWPYLKAFSSCILIGFFRFHEVQLSL